MSSSSTTSNNNPVIVALIGGTGRTGAWVLEELVQQRQKIKVKVLARSPTKLANYQDNNKNVVDVVVGDATDPAALVELLHNVDVVISTIGSPNQETLVVEATAKALVAAIAEMKQQQDSNYKLPRIIWMTATGVNEATAQAKMYPLIGNKASGWLFGYGVFGLLVFKILIPFVIGQDLWDDMGRSELVLRADSDIIKQTVIVRPTNMHPVSEHATFSPQWKQEGGQNTKYQWVAAEDPPPGKWMVRRAIACALCDLISDNSRDGTAISLFQDGAVE